MNSKNWSDRADRDLFFTILSVKNIGVISGSEWVTIGNHMRVLGYGFTNEGCRQHFQGLRRAQNKTEQNGATEGSPPTVRKSADPTMNPITRRPGPGRGRPKKSNGEQEATPQQPVTPSVPMPIGDVQTPTHDVAGQPGPGSNPHFSHHHYQQPQQGQHPVPYPHQGQHQQWQAQPSPHYVHPSPQEHHHRSQPQMVHKQQQGVQQQQQQSPIPLPTQPVTYPSPQSAAVQVHRPVAGTASHQVEPDAEKAVAPGTAGDVPNSQRSLPLETDHGDDDEPDDEDEDDDDDVSDDRPSKRQKTEDEDAEGDGNLEDDPVLALANASNGGSADPYTTSDQFYGEA